MSIKSRLFRGMFSVLALVATHDLFAQSWPSRPIRLVIGYPPGGSTDIVTRAVGDEMAKRLGQPVIIENKPGASAFVAANSVKMASPDGYTLFGGSSIAYHPVMIKNGMDATIDMTPISVYAIGEWFVLVPTSLGISNLRELAAYGKKNKDMRLSVAATNSVLVHSLLAKDLGVTYEPIMYKTTDQTVQAMLNGDGQVTMNGPASFKGYLDNGKIGAIAVLSPERSKYFPNVATAKEQGVNLDMRFNWGFWGPPGLRSEIVTKVQAAADAAISVESVRERVYSIGMIPSSSSPEQLVKLNRSDAEMYRKASELTGFRPE